MLMKLTPVILHLLNSLRAEKGDRVAGKIDFLEGEAISKIMFYYSFI